MKMMVKDHEKAVAEFQKQSTQSKDTDVQEFARTTLPTLQEHLTMARDIDSKVSGKTGGR
jgi:putative membrane protein